MMNKRLKILTEFGTGDHKSLLIELDKTIVEQLPVDENGMVNAIDFINSCLIELSQTMSETNEMDLDRLIFDSNIAVDTRKRQ